MPAKKPLSATAHPPKHRKLLWTLVVFAVLLLAGIAALTVVHRHNQQAIAADQARFAQADKDLTILADHITQVHPLPLMFKQDNGCDRSSNEFYKGPLNCDTGYQWVYSVSNFQEANVLYESISNEVSKQFPNLRINDNMKNFNPPSADLLNQQIRERFSDAKASMICSVNFIFFAKNHSPYPELENSSINQYAEGVIVSCGGYAKNTYYKLRT